MRVATGAAVLLGALLLSGCGGDQPQPTTLPTLTPSPTVTETPSPDTTASPTRTPTADGASPSITEVTAELEAFVREFYRLTAEMYRSKTALEKREKLYAESCDSCTRGTEMAREAQRKGYTLVSSAPTPEFLGVDEWTNNYASFRVLLDVPAGTLKDADGGVVRRFEELNNVTVVYEARRLGRGQWVILAETALP